MVQFHILDALCFKRTCLSHRKEEREIDQKHETTNRMFDASRWVCFYVLYRILSQSVRIVAVFYSTLLPIFEELTGLLRLEIVHVGASDGFSEELQPTEGGNLSSVVVLNKESNALDALVLDVL